MTISCKEYRFKKKENKCKQTLGNCNQNKERGITNIPKDLFENKPFQASTCSFYFSIGQLKRGSEDMEH